MTKRYNKKPIEIVTCPVCLQEFPTKDKRTFCSKACMGKVQSTLGWKPRNCANCGEEFKPENSTRKFCSKCDEGRIRTIFTRYGLSRAKLTEILKQQDGTCALCDREAIFVDHCHTTNKVRGMLCPACNTALSRVEIPGWTDKAKDYLRDL